MTKGELEVNMFHQTEAKFRWLILQFRSFLPLGGLFSPSENLGYDFVHAIADLCDNSVTARASKISIEIRFDGSESWVKIADNGTGMAAETLNEAMRYGSERKYDADELGKFGLGLKTASTSQCRRLTVVSRAEPERRRFEGRILDLDHIEKTNRWEVHRIDADEISENLTEPIKDGTGTVVLWECLDRVLNYKLPWGERAKNGLLTMVERLDQHLGMVFHQFLDSTSPRRRKLAITINGTIVEAWDPFATAEKDTEKLTAEEFEITGSAGKGIVKYRPYVLPVKEKFSSDAAFNRAGGPERWNRQQGFYVYRAGRMIQSGGWSWMRTADEHTKLARAAIEFYPDLDSAFGINVAKMRVSLPGELRDKLKIPVERLAKRARDVYDRKTTAQGKSSSVRALHHSQRRGPRARSRFIERLGDPIRVGGIQWHTPNLAGCPRTSRAACRRAARARENCNRIEKGPTGGRA